MRRNSSADDEENDLTSLSWLHNVTISLPEDTETTQSSAPQFSVASEPNRRLLEVGRDAATSSSSSSSSAQKSTKSRSSTSRAAQPTANSKRKLLVHQRTNVSQLWEQHRALRSTHDYAGDANIKPPFSYAALICLAMSDADARMSLSQIYKWIKENFAYYRHGDKSWQNSIRHNLSLNKCFVKIARGKGEPGKGGFWTLNPQYRDVADSDAVSPATPISNNESKPEHEEPPSSEWPSLTEGDAEMQNADCCFVQVPTLQQQEVTLVQSSGLQFADVLAIINSNNESGCYGRWSQVSPVSSSATTANRDEDALSPLEAAEDDHGLFCNDDDATLDLPLYNNDWGEQSDVGKYTLAPLVSMAPAAWACCDLESAASVASTAKAMMLLPPLESALDLEGIMDLEALANI